MQRGRWSYARRRQSIGSASPRRLMPRPATSGRLWRGKAVAWTSLRPTPRPRPSAGYRSSKRTSRCAARARDCRTRLLPCAYNYRCRSAFPASQVATRARIMTRQLLLTAILSALLTNQCQAQQAKSVDGGVGDPRRTGHGKPMTAVERGELAVRGRPAMNPPLWTQSVMDNAWKHWGIKERPADYARAFRDRYGLHAAPYENGALPM